MSTEHNRYFPWEIDDIRSPGETVPANYKSPSRYSEADFDMEVPHTPFIPQLHIQAAGKQNISNVQMPTLAQIAQTLVIQAQA